MNPVKELNKVASSVASFNEKLATEILEVSEAVHDMKIAQIEDETDLDETEEDAKIVDRIDETSDRIEDIQDQLDEVIDELDAIADDSTDTAEKIAKKADAKSVGLFNEGDSIVLCGSEIQGVYSGRIYLCGPELEKGYILVKEESGDPVGIFKKERFCINTRAY